MNANDKTLDAIFGMTRQLVVPLFQRPYVWNEEENWEPLWESVREVAERRLRQELPWPHFMGAIVLNLLPYDTGDVESRQVIDGQQRVTTLQLLLAAIRDFAQDSGATEFASVFQDLTRNKVPGSKCEQDEFKVWPTNRDRDVFAKVMKAGSPDAVKRALGFKTNSKRVSLGIADAYLYFCETLEEWFAEEGDPMDVRLQALYKTLTSDLILVVIDLGERDDPQLIFETLNFLGQPLLPADLVKNFLFHHAQKENADIQAVYDKHWAQFDADGDFWREKVTQGRLTRPRLDLFLQHYLTRHLQQVIGATHLFAEFKEFFRKSGDGTLAHIENLHEHSDVFKSMLTMQDTSPEGTFLQRLRILDTAMVYPLLLEVFRSDFCQDERRQILADVESYLVRRALGVMTTKGYNRQFVELLKRCEKDGYHADVVRRFLLTREGSSAAWPTDEELRNSIRHQTVYRRLRREIIQMILEAIDREFQDARTERVIIDEQLTVEHIMPQLWEEHWPLEAANGLEEVQAKQRREQLLGTLGNLTLVTGSLNPSLSNSAWDTKREALAEHSALAMNRRLAAREVWNENAIQERADELLEGAKAIWPRPNV